LDVSPLFWRGGLWTAGSSAVNLPSLQVCLFSLFPFGVETAFRRLPFICTIVHQLSFSPLFVYVHCGSLSSYWLSVSVFLPRIDLFLSSPIHLFLFRPQRDSTCFFPLLVMFSHLSMPLCSQLQHVPLSPLSFPLLAYSPFPFLIVSTPPPPPLFFLQSLFPFLTQFRVVLCCGCQVHDVFFTLPVKSSSPIPQE